MKRGRQVDRDHRIPTLFRKIDDLGDVLNAGIVDQDVDRAEFAHRIHDELSDLGRLRHVCGGVADADAVLLGDTVAQPLDRRRIAKAVQHHIAALGRQSAGDAEPDAAGRAGDDRGFAS